MKLSQSFALLCQVAITATAFHVHDANIPLRMRMRQQPIAINLEREQRTSSSSSCVLRAVPPRGGLSFEEKAKDETEGLDPLSSSSSSSSSATVTSSGGGGAFTSSTPFSSRGKLNEIDFCMSPSDVSISRLYQTSSEKLNGNSNTGAGDGGAVVNKSGNDTTKTTEKDESPAPKIMSLTRALNNASNRAVRRILLSRSWPSPEALNYSLRQVLASGGADANGAGASPSPTNSASEEQSESDTSASTSDDATATNGSGSSSDGKTAKCPVPRPILNIIMKEQQRNEESGASSSVVTDGKVPVTATRSNPLGRKGGTSTDEQWVQDQLIAFQDTYGDVKGYEFAEAYMECILSLATKGVESDRVAEVMEQGVYEDAYRRILSVLKSVGVTFEGVDVDDDDNNKDESDSRVPKMKIASKLQDQDICLSMIDKLNIQNEIVLGDEARGFVIGETKKSMVVVEEIKKDDDTEEQEDNNDDSVDDSPVSEKESDTESATTEITKDEVAIVDQVDNVSKEKKQKKQSFADKLIAWIAPSSEKVEVTQEEVEEKDIIEEDEKEKEEDDDADGAVEEEEEEEKFKPEDLGGVLLSAEEPTVTRQLNVLSNIVKRTLLFGGDQEILVLSKTLEADKPAFIKRWYPDTVIGSVDDLQNETRPGVQFFNCLVELLKECYSSGVVTTLDPLLPLAPIYANSYERLTALLVELGSGYIKPAAEANQIPKNIPKTATEEFIRFSQWEVALRQIKPDVNDYPEDLVGTWQVKDEIGGKTIGTSTVVFKPEGEVFVTPPLKGLQWRLDPGPTHLDTCTFQVLSEDGAILQYRGFMDRGARLESRFSKRSIKIRGAVSFQMRDGEQVAERGLLPLNTESGTTRFVMSKVFDLNN